MKTITNSRLRGLTLIEILGTVAVVAIIASVAAWKLSGVKDSAEETRLTTHVASLNAAVEVYQASGGSLENLTSAQAVIDKMKTLASNGEKMAGFSGTFVDPRLTTVEQTDEEAADLTVMRVIWDETTKTFKVAENGEKGIKEFRIDPTATPDSIVTEERDTIFELAVADDQGAWVWDFDHDTNAFASGVQSTAGGDASLSINPEGSTYGKQQLLQPSTDPSPGTYGLADYGTVGKPVVITNPNSADDSELWISVNGVNWTVGESGASVEVPPGGSLSCFAHVKESAEADYYSSYVRSGLYEATTIQLQSPSIGATPSQFHPFDSPEVVITAADSGNDPAHSKLVYQADNGEWLDYAAPVSLNVDAFENPPTIYAKSVSSHPDPKWAEYYLESTPASVGVPIEKVDLVTPEIAVSPTELHPFTSDTVSVSLSRAAGDPDTEGAYSKLAYSVDGNNWVDFNGDFSLAIDDHSDGVNVLAKSIPIVHLTSINDSVEATAQVDAAHVILPEPAIVLSNPALDPLDNIELLVSMTIPGNIPTDKTAIRYSTNDGADWNDYAEPFSLHLAENLNGATLIAKAVPTAHLENITASGERSASIPVNEATLVAPEMIVENTVLNAVAMPSTSVTINNPNSDAVSAVQYAINGGDWFDYTDEIEITQAAYSSGLQIEAKVIATQYTPILHNSDSVMETIYVRLLPPIYSLESHSCCENLYDKSLLLSDTNAGGATIVYSMDGEAEQVYTPVVDPLDEYAGAINIPGNTTVTAYCQAPDDTFLLDSLYVTHTFTAEPHTELDPPVISPDGGTFTELALITIEPPAANPEAQVIYTLDGSDPAVDEDGNIVNGEIYTEAITLEYFESLNQSLTLDWEDSAWNDGTGWFDTGGTQSLLNIGGLGIDVTLQQMDSTALGAVLANFGDDVWLGADGGDNPNLGYSILFSESVQLDTFSTGGLAVLDDISMANRIDLYGDDGTQLVLGSLYVTSSQFADVFFSNGGVETVATSSEFASQTDYDFGGLTIQELQWLHYGYQTSELAPPTPPTPDPDDECQYTQSFTLINADTGEPIVGYDPIPDGIKINLAHLPTNISVRANVNGTSCGDGNNGHGNNEDGFDSSNQGNSSGVGGVEDSDPTVDDEMHNHPAYGGNGIVGSAPKSVRMLINGSGRNENSAPYSLKGDSGGSYTPWNPGAGSYTITATPYKKKNAGGNAGTSMTMTIEVIDDAEIPEAIESLDLIGHDMAAFLSDINFHVADTALLPATYSVKALAVPVGIACRTYSQVAEANFVINSDAPGTDDLPTPNITPSEGRFFAQVEVSIEAGDGSPVNTLIYYTTDGSTPAGDEFGNPTSGTEYTGPFTISHPGQPGSDEITKYVRARAFAPEGQNLEFTPSNSASAQMDITAVERLNSPDISPEGGSYNGLVEVAMTATSAPEGSSIYYTLDGSDPGDGDVPTGGILYTGPFTVQHDASSPFTISEIVSARVYPPADEAVRYQTSYLNDQLYVFSPNFTITFDESWLDFGHGTLVGDEYANYGGGVSIMAGRYDWENDRALIFNSNLSETADDDLEAPFLSGNAAGGGFGNVLIVAENLVDSNGDGIIDSADDNGSGGYSWFDFESSNISNVGFDILDIDNGEHAEFGAYFYDDSWNGTFVSGTQLASSYGTGVDWGDHSANRFDPITASQLGLTNISGLVFTLPQSGGFDNITFGID